LIFVKSLTSVILLVSDFNDLRIKLKPSEIESKKE